MKKIFSIAITIVLLVAVVSLVACQDEQEICFHTEYTDEIVESTCDTMGYTNHVCVGCGHSYKDNYTEEHHYVEVAKVAPACNTEGYTEYKCEDCGKIIRKDVVEKNPTVHTYVYPNDEKYGADAGKHNITGSVAPTCYDFGYSIETCIYCLDSHHFNYVSPAHSFGEYKLVSSVACGDNGIMRASCENCSAVDEYWVSEKDYTNPADAFHNIENVTVTLGTSNEKHYCDCGKYYYNEHYNDVVEYVLVTEGEAKHYVVNGYNNNESADKSYVDIPLTVDEIFVTEITGNAFINESALTTLYIPESVTKIGAFAFSGCTSLTTIYFEGTEEQWKAVEKLTGWDYATGNYTVVFTK